MAVRRRHGPSVSCLRRRGAHLLLGSRHTGVSKGPREHAQSHLGGTRRAHTVEHGRGARSRLRAARRVEGTARGRGHVRGAQTLRQGHGEQVREEVQVVQRVTPAINNDDPTWHTRRTGESIIGARGVEGCPPVGINGHRQLTSII